MTSTLVERVTRHLDAGGVRLAYSIHGADGIRADGSLDSADTPLLLINGLTRPMRSWEHVISAASTRTTVAFDAPGLGDSPIPLFPQSIPALADLAERILDACGVPEADVLGFSHGGLVAQQLAASRSARVRRLVLVSTTCGAGGTTSPLASLRRSHVHDAGQAWPPPDPLVTAWQAMAACVWSSVPFLGSIRQPTLVVHGSRDRLVPISNATLLARRIPGARLVCLPTGHDLQRADHAGLLWSTANEFLEASSEG